MNDRYDVLLRAFADLSAVKLCQRPVKAEAEHALAATVLYCIRPAGHLGLHRALVEWCDHLGQGPDSAELGEEPGAGSAED